MLERLDRKVTKDFTRRQHARQKRLDGSPAYHHSFRVADLAEAFSRRHFCRFSSQTITERLTNELSWHVGCLHDTLEDGTADFDDIVAITNMEIAELVASISHDKRLPSPKRVMVYVNALAFIDPRAMVVKLADIVDNLQDMLSLLQTARAGNQVKLMLGRWPDEVLRSLESLGKISTGELAPEFRWCQHTAECFAKIATKPKRLREALKECRPYVFQSVGSRATRKRTAPRKAG